MKPWNVMDVNCGHRTNICFLLWILTTCFCKKCPDIIQKQLSIEPQSSTMTSINEVIACVCMKADTDRLVYRYQNDSHIFLGFDVIKDDVIYSMSWETTGKRGGNLISQNINTNGYDRQPAVPFRIKLNTDHLLAASNNKEQRRFENKLQKCHRSILTKSCLIQTFAASAKHMKLVDIDQKCVLARSTHRLCLND